MAEVTCVGCGKLVPMTQADIVGLGYRCNACSFAAEQAEERDGIPDVGDHIDIRERDKLAREGKRLFVGSMVGAGIVIAGPAVAAGILWGGLAALGASVLGLYIGGQWIATGVDVGLAKWRRYGRQAMLPGAKLVLHDGRGVAHRERVGPVPEQEDTRLADEEQRPGDQDRAADPPRDTER